MRVTFFRFAERKSPKKGRPCCARPFAALRATCDARSGGAPQNSLRAARSVQTTAASQCTKCVCPAAHARTPCPALLGTRRRDPAAGHPFGPLLRSAAPARREALAHGRSGRAKQRPVWLFGCSAVWMFGCSAIHPLPAAPAAGRLRGGACGASAPMLRHLTRRGCPSGARQRKASSTAHPATAPTQVCPVAKRWGRRLGVALSLVTFFRRRERKLLARRATPGLHPQQRHAFQTSTPRLRQAQPERVAGNRSYQNNSYRRFIDKR